MERPDPQLGTHNETLSKRIIAWIVDAILIALITLALRATLWDLWNWFGFVGGWGLLSFAYFIYFEAEYGQTPGKKVMDIVAVKEDGGDCDWPASIVRNVFRVVDGFAFYLLGMIFILLTDENQRLGDIVANTVVVKVAPAEDDELEWSGLVIEDVYQETGDRYVDIRKEGDKTVDLSRATITDGDGNRFRVREGFTIEPDETETFHVDDTFARDPNSTLTLTTQDGKEYEIIWNGASDRKRSTT
jgi:uncharacterized RDD family membrane protein YckC